MYAFGLLSAVSAGITFNLGMVIQKMAVQRVSKEGSLIRQLIRSPLWLVGFGLQFCIGMPLNMLAQAYLGPAIIPGLMSIGLVVLALGAVWLAHEPLGLPDVAGICLVMVAIALLGFTRLSIDLSRVDFYEPGFMLRLVFFTSCAAALSLVCRILQGRLAAYRAVFHTLNAGLLFVQSNLWLGIMMGLFSRWSTGSFAVSDLLPAGAAALITFAGSMLGISETQRAFQTGQAARVVPIQSLPVQTLPLVSYFAVFRLPAPTAASVPVAACAVALIVAGSALLARGQESNRDGAKEE